MKIIKVMIICLLVLLSPGATNAQAAKKSYKPEARAGSIQFKGLMRTFLYYLPSNYESLKSMPLVFAIHGGGGQGEAMEHLSLKGFNRLADRDGFIVVYPDGIEQHWNDGRDIQKYKTQRENIDDVGYIAALIDHFAGKYSVDKSRVYATGISNGGIFSYRLACDLADKLAAVAPVAGGMPEKYYFKCSPARPVPLMAISNTKDPYVEWGGGEVIVLGAHLGRTKSVADSVGFFVSKNECSATPVKIKEPVLVRDGTSIVREEYSGCKNQANVVLYKVVGGGHTWPSGWQYMAKILIGKTSRNIDANAAIWEFFKNHKLR